MGRPIKKKFFGNTNTPQVGGEGISSSIIVDTTGTHYSAGAVLVFSAPQIPGGVTATGSPTVAGATAGGGITAVTLSAGGSGYTSTATISVTTASVVSRAGTGTAGASVIYLASTTGLYEGMRVTGTGVGTATTYVSAVNASSVDVTTVNAGSVSGTLVFMDVGTGFKAKTALTSSKQNALSVTAYLTTGSNALAADIIKQEASHRYLVRTSEGVGQCKLASTSTIAAGQMYITATDSLGGTYCVTKLTARRAVLTRAGGTSFEFATNSVAGWTTGSASTGVVSIANS